MKRIYLLAAVLAVVIGLSVWGIFEKISVYKMSQQDILVKNQTQQAVSMLEVVYEGYQEGMYPLDQAKSMAASLIRGLRYGDNNEGYFWADTSDGTNVVHAIQRNIEGKNRMDAELSGVFYIKDIISNGKKPGGGFTDFFFPKPGGNEPLAKRAFSLYFEPFDWIVGTGYYLEDVK